MAAKKKTSTKRKTNTRSKKKTKDNDFSSFHSEVIILITSAIMILLFLSNFGICGTVGNAVSQFFFGIFGIVQFLMPIMCFLGIGVLVANDYSTLAIKKVAISFLGLSMISTIAHLITYTDSVELSVVYTHSAAGRSGGGLIGALIGDFLHKYLGIAGAYIVVLVLIIISVVLITETSFLALVKSGSSHVMENVKESREVSLEQRREKKELQENEKKVKPTPKADKPKRNIKLKKPKLFENATVLPEDEESISLSEEKKVNQELMFDDFLVDQETGEILDQNTAEPLDFTVNMPAEAVPEAAPIEEVQAEIVLPEEQPAEAAAVLEQPRKRSVKPVDEIVTPEINIDIQPEPEYQFPPLSLLKPGSKAANKSGEAELKATAIKLKQTLDTFGVKVTITNVSMGPAVTRYEMQPELGVKVSKIVGLADDIKLNLAAEDIRIEAPIPGKAAVGIEVPNKTNTTVAFRDLIDNADFKKFPSDLAFAVGKDIGGKVIITDIAKMPHLLVAGATGSGKSVCINTIIMSLIYKSKPSDVKLIMIDPKVVELSVYNGIPHLLIPVVTDPKKAAGALNWAVMEMTDRYKKFAEVNVRNLKGYNKKVEDLIKAGEIAADSISKLPQIVIIVDELADLMMVAPGEVEDAIVRLSQLARAAGIHLVIATQRPSVNVITGLIKANVPSRIAFSVSSGVDSRTIIDMNGAEKLLGKGDMLFYPSGYTKPIRVQGAFVSDKEVNEIVEFLKAQNNESEYNKEITEQITSVSSVSAAAPGTERDEYFMEAGKFIIEKEKASIGMLQRVYKIGFNRAARIMDQLSEAGVVGPEEGTKPRKVLMSMEEFEQYIDEYV